MNSKLNRLYCEATSGNVLFLLKLSLRWIGWSLFHKEQFVRLELNVELADPSIVGLKGKICWLKNDPLVAIHNLGTLVIRVLAGAPIIWLSCWKINNEEDEVTRRI